ncbi:GAP family protein [Kitasatospora camelliae]|uniref:GAP family protein n=1 Tax=Kitasatospora camelliae TaxID=3156397 RepID=A0AAU8K7P7_9ACTN
MGEAIGAMLASAVGIAISPLPLIAVILLLATPRGRTNGPAFAAGWTGGLAAVVALVAAAGSGLGTGGDEATWNAWLRLALGVLLLLLALRQWRRRPRAGHVIAPPSWMQEVDRFTAPRAAGLGLSLVLANPKNLVLAVGGAAAVSATPGSGATRAVAGVLLVLIGSLCVLVPLGTSLVGGKRAARLLGEWKAWTAVHNAAVTTTVLAVLGATYVGDALTVLG